MDYALSSDDITKLFKGKVKIVRYRDLKHFATVDVLLKPYNKVFILYESKNGFGHWTVLHKLNSKNLEMFDSYGLKIDEELDQIPKAYRKESNQIRAYLSKLLGDSKYTIHYNDHQFQDLKRGISTCGRWCVARCVNNDCSIDEFYRKIRGVCDASGINPDELVCDIVKI